MCKSYANNLQPLMGMEGSYYDTIITKFNYHKNCYSEIPLLNKYIKDRTLQSDNKDLMEFYLSCLDADLVKIQKYFNRIQNYNIKFILELLLFYKKSTFYVVPYCYESNEKHLDEIIDFFVEKNVDINIDNIFIKTMLFRGKFNTILKYLNLINEKLVFKDLDLADITIHDEHNYNNEIFICDNPDYITLVKSLFEKDKLNLTISELFVISKRNPELINYFLGNYYDYPIALKEIIRNIIGTEFICGNYKNFSYDKYLNLDNLDKKYIEMAIALQKRDHDNIKELLKDTKVFGYDFYDIVFDYSRINHTRQTTQTYLGEKILSTMYENFICNNYVPNKYVFEYIIKSPDNFDEYILNNFDYIITNFPEKFMVSKIHKFLYKVKITDDICDKLFGSSPVCKDINLIKQLNVESLSYKILPTLKNSLYYNNLLFFEFLFDKLTINTQIEYFKQILYDDFINLFRGSYQPKHYPEIYISILQKYDYLTSNFDTLVAILDLCVTYYDDLIIILLERISLTKIELNTLINVSYDKINLFDKLISMGADPLNNENLLDVYILTNQNSEICKRYSDKIDVRKNIKLKLEHPNKIFKTYLKNFYFREILMRENLI